MSIDRVATSGVLAVLRKLAAPATQDKLVKRAQAHPKAPSLSWRERLRLKKMVATPDATAALFDQDAPGAAVLSALIAAEVFKKPDSAESMVLADILIAEIPGCLTSDELAVLNAYKLRRIAESIEDLSDQVRDVGSGVREVGSDFNQVSANVSDIRQLLLDRTGVLQVDPEVLIAGPLRALGLETDYAEIRRLDVTDPGRAAELLLAVIAQVRAGGSEEQTRPFITQRAQLLTRARSSLAIDAWVPMVDEFLSSGSGSGLHEPLEAWRSLIGAPEAPDWLPSRIAVVDALESWLYGDVPARDVLALAIAANSAGDPESALWLTQAAEGCLVDRDHQAMLEAREVLISCAEGAENDRHAARLYLAVADASSDEAVWRQLLSQAGVIDARFGPDAAGLIHARRGRDRFLLGKIDEALHEYRLSFERAGRGRLWGDAAAWARSAIFVMNRADSIILGDLETLRHRRAAFQAAGDQTQLPQSEDIHFAALASLAEMEGGGGSARRARSHLRRYQRRSIVLGVVDGELTSQALTGRFYMQLDDPDSAVGHFIQAGDIKQAAAAAARLTHFHDCLAEAQGTVRERRAVAFRVAADEADLIPDQQVSQWTEVALAEAKTRDYSLMGPSTYVNSYRLIEGLAWRFPADKVEQLLAEINLALPRPMHTGRPNDDQLGKILIRLGASADSHQDKIAESIALAFEQADDIADSIAPFANSLSAMLLPVKDRLLALLDDNGPDKRHKRMNATMALVEIGDRSPKLLEVADELVGRELNRPLAYSRNSAARVAWVSESAVYAKCLPPATRVALARHYVQRVLDSMDLEANRASYADALVVLGPVLPLEVRDDAFDRLYPQNTESQEPTNIFDVMAQRFRNPLGRLRISPNVGVLRRSALIALAVLAGDSGRQEQVWRAAQRLIVSGQRRDSVCVAEVGYKLSQSGFAPLLPWSSMAYSADPEMRQLAAALIPFAPEIDNEALTGLAADTVTNVRAELAISLRKIATTGNWTSVSANEIDTVIGMLRNDSSFRVRSKLPPDVHGSSD
ncbi:hypothetical protein [Mycolicibacterium sp. XJ870]